VIKKLDDFTETFLMQFASDMANAIITTQTKEIEQMKQWKAAWYK
jgi:uncharacterized protein (DUF305 family)